MDLKSRREFLSLGIASLSSLAFAGSARDAGVEEQKQARTPKTLDRFIDPLPVPARLTPFETSRNGDRYRVRMLECEHRFHSQLPAARVWGYEGHYPGPTIQAFRGRPIEVVWENRLPLQHLFEVDPHIHGAMPPAPAVRTVPHLHGSRSRSQSDGLPEKWFTPGSSARYQYPNEQQAATLWYHDHALGITRLNMYAGMSGFYLLRDEDELKMDLPSGKYEIPLVVQDRMLDDQGQLVYAPAQESGEKLPPGVWGPQFFGELPVINGAVYPFLDVEPRRYRLRVLNAANSRFFNLYFKIANSPADMPELVILHQIGSDGGFLGEPAALRKLLLAPAERADLIVDFSACAGKTVIIMNDAPAPYPGPDDPIRLLYRPLLELMQFRVSLPVADAGGAIRMPSLRPLPAIDPSLSEVMRDFVLAESFDANGRSLGMRINNKGYDEPVTEFPKLGSIETWRFINMTEDAHPMHLHLVQFRILHRQFFNYDSFLHGKLEFVGKPRPPQPNEAGWKDTAIVNPRDALSVQVRFEGYAGRYVYHCHVAEHEDNDMMRPYEVVA